jgi:hypothetical protein
MQLHSARIHAERRSASLRPRAISAKELPDRRLANTVDATHLNRAWQSTRIGTQVLSWMSGRIITLMGVRGGVARTGILRVVARRVSGS